MTSNCVANEYFDEAINICVKCEDKKISLEGSVGEQACVNPRKCSIADYNVAPSVCYNGRRTIEYVKIKNVACEPISIPVDSIECSDEEVICKVDEIIKNDVCYKCKPNEFGWKVLTLNGLTLHSFKIVESKTGIFKFDKNGISVRKTDTYVYGSLEGNVVGLSPESKMSIKAVNPKGSKVTASVILEGQIIRRRLTREHNGGPFGYAYHTAFSRKQQIYYYR